MLKIYAVYDLKARNFGNPVFLPNDEVAKRVMASWCNTGMMHDFPEDFQLFNLGEYHESTGEFYSAGDYDVPEKYIVCTGLDFKEVKNGIPESD